MINEKKKVYVGNEMNWPDTSNSFWKLKTLDQQ